MPTLEPNPVEPSPLAPSIQIILTRAEPSSPVEPKLVRRIVFLLCEELFPTTAEARRRNYCSPSRAKTPSTLIEELTKVLLKKKICFYYY